MLTNFKSMFSLVINEYIYSQYVSKTKKGKS